MEDDSFLYHLDLNQQDSNYLAEKHKLGQDQQIKFLRGDPSPQQMTSFKSLLHHEKFLIKAGITTI